MTTPRLGKYRITPTVGPDETVFGVLKVADNGTLSVSASRIVGNANQYAPIRVYAAGAWVTVAEEPSER